MSEKLEGTVVDNKTTLESACKNCGHLLVFVQDKDLPEYDKWMHFNPFEGDCWIECYLCDCETPEPQKETDAKCLTKQ